MEGKGLNLQFILHLDDFVNYSINFKLILVDSLLPFGPQNQSGI